MYAILEDRYGGVYSGGKWLLLQNSGRQLTEIELKYLNKELEEVDNFYSSRAFGIDRSSLLSTASTRMDAVEATFQGADCYAAIWNFEILPWVTTHNTLAEVQAEIDKQEANKGVYRIKLIKPDET